MNALLDLAITAHGGLDRWNKVTSIKVDTSNLARQCQKSYTHADFLFRSRRPSEEA